MYEVVGKDGVEVLIRNLNDGGIERVGVRDLCACANGGIRVGFTYGQEVIPYRFNNPVIDNSNLARMKMAGFKAEVVDGDLRGLRGARNSWVVLDDICNSVYSYARQGGDSGVCGMITYNVVCPVRFFGSRLFIVAGALSLDRDIGRVEDLLSHFGVLFVSKRCLMDNMTALVSCRLKQVKSAGGAFGFEIGNLPARYWNMFLKRYLKVDDGGKVGFMVPRTVDVDEVTSALVYGREVADKKRLYGELRKCNYTFRKAYRLLLEYGDTIDTGTAGYTLERAVRDALRMAGYEDVAGEFPVLDPEESIKEQDGLVLLR